MTSGRNFCNDILDCDIPVDQYRTFQLFNKYNAYLYGQSSYEEIVRNIANDIDSSISNRFFFTHTLPAETRIVKQLIPLHFSRRQNKLIA